MGGGWTVGARMTDFGAQVRAAPQGARERFQLRIAIASGIALGAYLARTPGFHVWYIAAGVALLGLIIFLWETRND